MEKIPQIFYRVTTQVVYFVVVPLLFLSFELLYRPAPSMEMFSTGSIGYAFNIIMLMLIMAAVMAVSRMLVFILRHHLQLNWIFFALWTLGELLLTAMFAGLYLTLMSHGRYAYFSAAGHSFLYLLMANVYPLTIITLLYERYWVSIQTTESTEQLIRLSDSAGKLKVVVTADNLLYVEAKENYVKIAYTEADRVAEYILHNTMKGIEPIMNKHGIVRCQRSYYVNPRRVAVLRKDKDGVIVAQLDLDKAPTIPVSPKYYDNLAMLL